ncbi:Uncharacterized protein SAMN05428959_103603 [Duganella sp. CF517]|uniref:YCF48-related protein n=1 Tax=Duganella sp. CF517 TaxID=1881038 RepID=UPI0008C23F4D|nr:YCF48-related protein [Duganella sp. CF517]SEN88622.1 Uncharacterized protein SAMN05428959_103603 [Duganella sp. CF517]
MATPPSPARKPRHKLNAWFLLILVWLAATTWVAMRQLPPPIGINWFKPTSFWTPLERNAFLRLPDTGAMRFIMFLRDGRRGWGLSTAGDLVGTDNGGADWSPIASALTQVDALAFSADGRLGWAVGGAGLRRTTDGGRRWTTVSAAALEGKRWTSIAFDPAGRHGVVVGLDGAFASSDDGGEHWRSPTWSTSWRPGRDDALKSAFWSDDGEKAWVVGDRGTLLTTDNSGATWRRVSGMDIDTRSPFVKVRFLRDGKRGWIVNEAGDLFWATDGGRDWRRVDRQPDLVFSDIERLEDGKHGWATTQAGRLSATRDGGQTWTHTAITGHSRIYALAAQGDGARLWIAGSAGIVHSNDGGVGWQAQTRNALGRISSPAFAADGRRGWAVGSGGTIIATADGGATWAAQTSAGADALNAVAVHRDGLRGWAVGDNGSIQQTVDGGQRWTRAPVQERTHLIKIVVAKDGLHGVALGQDGPMLLTSDGGTAWRRSSEGLGETVYDLALWEGQKELLWAAALTQRFRSENLGETWHAVPANEFRSPRGIVLDGGRLDAPNRHDVGAGIGAGYPALPRFSADGARGWWTISNRFGSSIIYLSGDGGRDWWSAGLPEGEGPDSPSTAATFLEDGLRGWAMRNGTLYATTDGGANWREGWAGYRRLPALWYWVALLPAIVMLRFALRRRRSLAGDKSAAGMFVDDDAIAAFEDDRLEFGPLARGLSRFLRNKKTSPPLTLAITGDWGTGKSSLMRLLCADLKRYGQRPIWFNAWHHQKDEQLFSALLGAIRAEAAPSSLKPAGWIFRLKLLWIRSKQHFLLSFILLVLVSSACAFPFRHSVGELLDLLTRLAALPKLLDGSTTAAASGLGVQQLAPLAQLLALCAAVAALYKGMKAFGVDPAVMVKGVSEHISLRQATAQNNFRAAFAQQFEEVADALPYRMTIVVDDLDRCRPENILEVLETVNFLTASGKCFVVFGMATSRVAAALGMAFEKIANELAAETATTLDGPQPLPEEAARRRRRAYAHDYLEKLINLEIMVPTRGEIGADTLFSGRAAGDDDGWRQIVQGFAAAWPLCLAAAAICLGILIGATVRMPASEVTPAAATPPAAASPSAAPSKTASPSAPAQVPAAQASPVQAKKFQSGQVNPVEFVYGLPLALLAVMSLILLMHGLLRLREQAIEVRDSDDFKKGLKVWTEVAAQHRNTPRAIKRWGNRLRYFAMLQQGSAPEETIGERWRRESHEKVQRLGIRLGISTPGAAAPPPRTHIIIEETRLIAIGAAHEAYGWDWRGKLERASYLGEDDPLRKAMREHPLVTGQPWWPVSDDEAQAFERLLAGIKLPPAGVDASLSATRAHVDADLPSELPEDFPSGSASEAGPVARPASASAGGSSSSLPFA